MTRGVDQLNVVLFGHMVSLHLVLIPRHGSREPVLGELRQFFVLVVRLDVVYFALLAWARRCRVEELSWDDPFTFTIIRGKRVCEDLLV